MPISSINFSVALRSAKTILLLSVSIVASGCETLETESQTASDSLTVPKLHEIPDHDDSLNPELFEETDESETDESETAEPEIFPEEDSPEEDSPAEPKPAVTAEAYMSQFDDRSRRYLHAELPADELEKAVALLQARFPLESIRDRLDFQMKAPSSSYSPGYRDRRTSALAMLHSEYVDTFISGEGQGIGRISPISPSDLRSRGSEYAPRKFVSEEVGSDLLGEPQVQLDPEFKTRPSRAKMDEGTGRRFPDPDHFLQLSKNGLPKQQLVSEFNRRTTGRFINHMGFVKNLDEVAGFETHHLKMPGNWDQNLRSGMTYADQSDNDKYSDGPNWKVNQLQLVSLLMHDQPVVYVADELPNMDTLSSANAETRSLNAFETDGLEKLQAGESMHIQATRNRIEMMGAVRAGVTCRQCHAVQENELLGAFSYEFLRTPRLTDDPTD
ncbi:hypothetical protein N9Y42_08410 [Mariniblastus sp.]|nr:hypothetical protein [Mariniblastus sp.]